MAIRRLHREPRQNKQRAKGTQLATSKNISVPLTATFSSTMIIGSGSAAHAFLNLAGVRAFPPVMFFCEVCDMMTDRLRLALQGSPWSPRGAMLTALNAIGAWALYSLFQGGLLTEGWLIIIVLSAVVVATYATARLAAPPTSQDKMMHRRTLTAQELQPALLDPSMIFSEPQDVIAVTDISNSSKIEILRRWEYDVREQKVAQEENMPGELPITLAQVNASLNAIGALSHRDHSPPTKQRGL